MLTKKDLEEMKILVRQEMGVYLDGKLDRKLDEKLDEKLKYLPSKDEFYTMMDQIMGELKAIREEHELMAYRVSDHSDRIEVLEQLHENIKSHKHTVVN